MQDTNNKRELSNFLNFNKKNQLITNLIPSMVKDWNDVLVG